MLNLSEANALSENLLVERCVAGDVAAWRQLHRRYYPSAQGFLRRMGVPLDELADSCQEVFLQVFRSLSSFRGEASLRTWIYRLCLTQACRRRRHRGVMKAVHAFLSSDPAPERVPPQEVSVESLQGRLQRALDRLSEGERATFVLYELEGASGKEIASVLKCPEATVWRRLHYARRTVRAVLEREAS